MAKRSLPTLSHGNMLFAPYRFMVRLATGTPLERVEFAKRLHRSVMRRLKPRCIEIHGHRVFLDATDALHLSLEDSESFALRFLKRMTKRGDVVLDIGAHIGYYTLCLARIVGEGGHVYAFEPDPTNFSLLKKNVKTNGYANVTLIQKAVSNVRGSSTLHLSDCSALHRLYPSRLCHRAIRVDTIRLDDYFKGEQRRINLIKLDIEGAESLALQGMSNLLERNPATRIFVEFVPQWIREAGLGPRISWTSWDPEDLICIRWTRRMALSSRPRRR